MSPDYNGLNDIDSFFFHFTHSANLDRDKADSEQMAVRTAEKLLKVGFKLVSAEFKYIGTSTEGHFSTAVISVLVIWATSSEKMPSKHGQNAQIKIILHMCRVSFGPFFSIHTFCSI